MNWLLLRGLSRELRHWGDFPALLERSTGGAVRCLDLPGAGTENDRPSPTTVAGITDDLRARWRVLANELPGPWGLMGMSLGGMVCLDWTARFPGDFARVVVANASTANLSPPWHRMQLKALADSARSRLDKDIYVRERRVIGMITSAAPDPDGLARTWAEYAKERPFERRSTGRQLVAALRFRAAEKITVPMLVLAGGADKLCNPECSRRIAQRYGATLEVHPKGGHELSIDVPDWVAERVTAFTRANVERAA